MAPTSRTTRVKWTAEEEQELTRGVQKYGAGAWRQILDTHSFHAHRTNVDLKDKWRNMLKFAVVPAGSVTPPSSVHPTPSPQLDRALAAGPVAADPSHPSSSAAPPASLPAQALVLARAQPKATPSQELKTSSKGSKKRRKQCKQCKRLHHSQVEKNDPALISEHLPRGPWPLTVRICNWCTRCSNDGPCQASSFGRFSSKCGTCKRICCESCFEELDQKVQEEEGGYGDYQRFMQECNKCNKTYCIDCDEMETETFDDLKGGPFWDTYYTCKACCQEEHRKREASGVCCDGCDEPVLRENERSCRDCGSCFFRCRECDQEVEHDSCGGWGRCGECEEDRARRVLARRR